MKNILALFVLTLLMFSCSEDDKPCVDCPVITLIDPAYGVVYESELLHYYNQPLIEIEGTNFGVTPEDNEVTFNGFPAVVYNASSTKLSVQPPYDAGSGPVVVTTEGKKSDSKSMFTVIDGVDCSVFEKLKITNVVIDDDSFSFILSNDEAKPVSLYGTTLQYWVSTDDHLGGGNDQAIGGTGANFECNEVLAENSNCQYSWSPANLSDNYLIIQLYEKNHNCNSVISVTEIP